MLGSEFRRTLRAAQGGNSDAFLRLWRDANPAMVRYLSVVSQDDPYDGACEGWITVIRGLPGFTGDELAWRIWLLACARMRAEEGTLRRAWGSVTGRSGGRGAGSDAGGHAPFAHLSGTAGHDDDSAILDDLDWDAGDLDEDTVMSRGLEDTLTAIRALPLGQGEVIMLRLGVGLPVHAVADVVGTDRVAILRAETRGLERLGIGRELLSWSLAAPASVAELADERVVASAFRSLPRPRRDRTAAGTKVIALTSIPGTRRHLGPAGRATGQAVVVGGAKGLSRAAVVAVVVASASVVSLGGVSAAAYAGVLPDPIQSMLHNAIGAPAPRPHPSPSKGGVGQPGGPNGSGVGHGGQQGPGDQGSASGHASGANGNGNSNGRGNSKDNSKGKGNAHTPQSSPTVSGVPGGPSGSTPGAGKPSAISPKASGGKSTARSTGDPTGKSSGKSSGKASGKQSGAAGTATPTVPASTQGLASDAATPSVGTGNGSRSKASPPPKAPSPPKGSRSPTGTWLGTLAP